MLLTQSCSIDEATGSGGTVLSWRVPVLSKVEVSSHIYLITALYKGSMLKDF
jgi:hypothetical protein